MYPFWGLCVASCMAITMAIVDQCPVKCTCYPHLTACNSKNLTEIPTDIPLQTEQLYFRGNQLGTLPQGVLSKYTNLKLLLLSNCEIETIQPNAFSGLINLSSLDLKWNKIQTLQSYLFSGLQKLKELHLEHNELESIENFAFHGLNLTRLGLERNDQLSKISDKAFHGTRIQVVKFLNSSLGSPAIRSLKQLRDSLQELFLQGNQRPLVLETDAFQGFTFKVLNLNGNGIKDIKFLAHVVTDELWLQNNPTGPIDFSRYPNLWQVRHLHLDNTSFFEVKASFFSDMNHLQYLGLAHNGITSMPEQLHPLFSSLTWLSLHDNNFHCNCEIIWLRHWLTSNTKVNVNNHKSVFCTTPSPDDITLLEEDYLTCSSPHIVTISPALNVSEKQEVLLTCVGEGDPAPTITWLSPDGQMVSIPPSPNRMETENQGIFHIDSISTANIGEYKCVATNHVGNTSDMVHVHVYKAAPVVGAGASSWIPSQAIIISLLVFSSYPGSLP